MNIIALRIVASIGILLAAYAIFVEYKLKRNSEYRPVCEINDRASCKVAFNSKYGRMLGISNAVLGIAFYIIFIVVTFTAFTNFLLLISIAAVLSSAYLAYALYFKLRNLCIVCTFTYLVNILLLYFVLF